MRKTDITFRIPLEGASGDVSAAFPTPRRRKTWLRRARAKGSPERRVRGASRCEIQLHVALEFSRKTAACAGAHHLARPHALDRTIDVLCDFNSASDAVDLQPPAEPAPDQVIVDQDFFQRQTGSLRRRRLGSRQHLGANPNLAASSRTWTVQFIGSIVACARNGT